MSALIISTYDNFVWVLICWLSGLQFHTTQDPAGTGSNLIKIGIYSGV